MIKTKDIFMHLCNSYHLGYQLNEDELMKLQSHLFKMYKDIESFCEKHGIKVCLAYGNVLGAIRHNGWIPWDDDLDVHMERKDYDLFVKELYKDLPEHYKLYSAENSNGSIARFAKLVDTNTVFVPIGGEKRESSGIFIDIFPIDSIGTNVFINKIKKLWMFFLMYTATSVNQVEKSSEKYKKLMSLSKRGKLNYYFRKLWGNLFSFYSSDKWHLFIERFWKNSKPTGYSHVKFGTIMCGQMIEDNVFFPFVKKKLSIGEVYLPNNVEKYLDISYGNNWKIIPDDNSKWHHYISEFYIPDSNE